MQSFILQEGSEALNAFVSYLFFIRGYSENTVNSYRSDVKSFFDVVKDKVSDIADIEKLLLYYSNHLISNNYKASSLERKLVAIKQFFIFSFQEGYYKGKIPDIVLPKKEKRLPFFLSREDVLNIFNFVSNSKPFTIRDLLIFKMLYFTGMRISELLNLKINSVNFETMDIRVFGKGSKERIIPFHHDILDLFNSYLIFRQENLKPKCENIFVNSKGRPLSRQYIWKMCRKVGNFLNLELHPHIFRHSLATHLLSGGASIKTIQEILGHESISTTQIYTHLVYEELKREYLRAFKNFDIDINPINKL
ncbi:integrase/recombinase XerD [Thermodesulfobium acidiphilum]|uniref:Integrase/recombinase XerD n=1 Tax=Thermodesulfobium acidiphilum TaxID=1794699 RepID=A0A2R4VZV4_THEAF|nr:site-specific tyrosine recombinase/integron integrase [Thermodesulfobium acidiphilum]AWB10042.1 integrase/recombinase XerD [Thermodesulfobium acidiphilum]